MKCAALTALVILTSFADCQDVWRQKRGAVHNPICSHVTAVTPEGFKAMVLVGLSQNLHQSTYEELIPLVQQIETAASACCDEGASGDCSKNELDLFQGAICASEEVTQKNHLEDCCAKTEADRHHCFLQHKKRIPRGSTFHDVPRKEKCEAYEKDRVAAMGHFIYQFSKSHVLLQPQVILGIAKGFEGILQSCCHDAHIDTCFLEKGTAMKHTVTTRIAQLKSICLVHEKYGLRVIKDKKLVQYSQKLPQATFEELAKITDQIAHMVSTCCKGEMINCMKERKQLVDDVCSKDELLSRTKHLAECCKLSIIERGGCIEKMEADDKPQDLSEKDDSFIKDKDVCEKYAQHGDQFLGSFLYEFSRRHPELSIQMILRVGKGYEAILDKCCKTDNPSECYGGAEEQLVLAIKETLVHFQQLCAAEKTFGKEGFEEFMLVQYTRIMPQAPYDELMRVAHTIATVTDSCCSKDESHLMPCAEEQLTNAIDETCSETNPATINEHIDHCCNESYSERRTCILKIQPDTTFVPQPFSPDMFHLDPDMCDMAPKQLLATTTRLLYDMVKLKTTITDEQFLTIGTSFLFMKAKCCTDADKALCFKVEVSHLWLCLTRGTPIEPPTNKFVMTGKEISASENYHMLSRVIAVRFQYREVT
ncbi:serum albumin 2-like [Acipenser oxyrinchus oxyrinchus]|uniref:Serum albumin 2-like n=1 Tax=Acipenser oxyrinchus oxyrinchus TaxID=40147 RepID=A0AAD8GJV6_ACIOX|nr:serum albumin 2-like [Acipenser oxyrinchus oxyrinchus]